MAIDPFKFHTKIDYQNNGTQYIGKCPFCHKEDHFFFNSEYQWDCKICKRSGNVYTFIQLIHSQCEAQCHELEALALERGFDYGQLSFHQIRYNRRNDSFVIPTTNDKGSINNLYKVYRDPETRKLNIVGTPSISSTPFNWPEQIEDEIWLTEGHWDKIAGQQAIGSRNITIVGYPGSTFKQTWCNMLTNRRVIIFPDNDEAGEAQFQQIMKRIEAHTQKPREVFRCVWPEGTPAKFDVNDLLKREGANTFSWILNHIEPCNTVAAVVDTEITADVSCTSFQELIEECKKAYHFTDDMELLMLLMFTALYSLKIDGEQIWIRVIGPPSSSKTTLAKVTGSSEQTVLRSTFTGLLSGWKDDEGTDASLIPLIAGKALIVKDADALLQQPNIQQIMSELRDFYDKDTSVTYRNRVNLDYKNIRTVFILCGTHVLRGMDNAALGDRFINFELRVTDADRMLISHKMLQRSKDVARSGHSPENSVWAKAKGFLDHHMMPSQGVAELTEEQDNEILSFCFLIAYMRATVTRTRQGEIAYKPHAEVPSRLVGQFTKAYMCAPRVLGMTSANELVKKLIRRCVIDEIDRESPRFKICKLLSILDVAVPRDKIIELTMLKMPVVNKELEDMHALGMLEIEMIRLDSQHQVPAVKLKQHFKQQLELLGNA